MGGAPFSSSRFSSPRHRKNAVFGLSILAVAILALSFWQFYSHLVSPFKPSKEELLAVQRADQEREAIILAEKNKDTDGDGLTDWEEINIYKTSPYLVDTDGDGISDFDEVRQGTDPLCAEGRNCSLVATNFEEINNLETEVSLVTPSSLIDQELLILALSGKADAATIRQILLQGGADLEQVNLLSDDDLLLIYEEILAVQTIETASSVFDELDDTELDSFLELISF